MQTTILKLPKVQERTGLSRSSILLKVSENSFPPPISLGGKRAIGWIESEVQAWIEEQIKLSRPDQ
jgi:prophage regulatory protein